MSREIEQVSEADGGGMMRYVAVLPLLLAACIPGGGTRDAAAAPPPPARTQEIVQPIRDEVERPAAAPPAWEARRVAADAQTIAATSYTVAPGDTLRGIADRTGSASEAIARANGLAAPFTIRAGQRLAVPGGRYHLVRSGQSGIAVARAYGVPWSEVVAVNQLAEPYILRTGQRILLPSATQVARMSAADRAAAFTLDIDDILTGGEPAIPERVAATAPTAAPARARALPSTAAVAAPVALRGGFDWPARGAILRRFGRGGTGERNDGIKIALPADSPVRASADGVVVYAGSSVPALGGLVLVKHGNGWVTAYGHAARIEVSRGQSVKRGQEIARSGDTGFADRPQLHFEIRKGRTPVDPLSQLPRT